MINEDVISNVDMETRLEEEWAKKYSIQIINSPYLDSGPIDEFEWAFKLQRMEYYKLPSKDNNYELADDMEVRAQKIVRDMIINADKNEKKILKQGKFLATDYVLDYRLKRR